MSFVHHFARRLGRLALVMALGIVAGCGAQTADVSGTIQLGGKAPNLEGLYIIFLAADGKVLNAPVAQDGTFTATGVPVGEVQVGLSYSSPNEQKLLEEQTRAHLPPDKRKPGAQELPVFKETDNPIPKEVRDPHTSGKAITVIAGQQNTLTWNVIPVRGGSKK